MTASVCKFWRKLHSCYMPHSPTDTICTSMTIQSLNIQKKNKKTSGLTPGCVILTVHCAGIPDSHHFSSIKHTALSVS